MQPGGSASRRAAVARAPASRIFGREDSRSSSSSKSRCAPMPCSACKGPSPSAGSGDIVDAALIAACTAAVETLHAPRTRALRPSPSTSLLASKSRRIARAGPPRGIANRRTQGRDRSRNRAPQKRRAFARKRLLAIPRAVPAGAQTRAFRAWLALEHDVRLPVHQATNESSSNPIRIQMFVTKHSSRSWRIASDSGVWRPRAGHRRKHDPGGEIVMWGDLPPNGPLRKQLHNPTPG